MVKAELLKAQKQKERYSDCYCVDVVIFKDGAFVVNMLDMLNPEQVENIKKIRVISTGVKKP
jgi:hypothetical protein